MTETVQEHDWSGAGGRVCIYCGTTRRQDGSISEGLTCVHRLAHPPGAPRPEPARREYAIDDAETISRRLGELSAERTEILNQKDGASEGAPPDVSFNCLLASA